MTSTAVEPLARLRERYPAPHLPRILVHRGTAGDALGAERYVEELRAALGDRADHVYEAASDGANCRTLVSLFSGRYRDADAVRTPGMAWSSSTVRSTKARTSSSV